MANIWKSEPKNSNPLIVMVCASLQLHLAGDVGPAQYKFGGTVKDSGALGTLNDFFSLLVI